jgi:CheY-like chemotaxis protein
MKRHQLHILVIDDDENDLMMIERAFRQNGIGDVIRCLDSGEKGIAYIKGDGEYADRSRFPYPAVVMTDLKMPGIDGFAVLQYLKEHPRWKMIPVLVFSSSADADDIKRSYAMGASCYLEKPSEPGKLRELLKLFYDFWKECEIPEIDFAGNQLQTEHRGKLGERFGPIR